MILWSLAGCGFEPGAEDLPVGVDYDAYVADVHPALEASCAQSACHGDAARPLEVYSAEHRLTEDTGDLTEEELMDEFLGAALFTVGLTAAEDSWLARKPLAESAGGLPHRGGDLYLDEADPEYTLLVEWIQGGVAP
jgi:hypothetical protein